MDNEELVKTGRFEKGQQVRVLPIEVGTAIGDLRMENLMCEYRWGVYSIQDKLYHYNRNIYKIQGWWFDEDWLESLEPEPELEPEIEIGEEKPIVLKYEATEEDIQEMISKVDINTFTKIIRARLWEQNGVSESFKNEMVMPWLREWAKAKFRFYKLFNKKLKIKSEIEIENDEQWFIEKINDLKIEFPLYAPIISSIYNKDIINNKITRHTFQKFEGAKKVKEEMKFTKFMALYNNKDLNMAVSKFYQTKNKRNVYISIDPCDFLTTSINKSWRSCHNFIDGEWRNAGLAFMQDNTSLIAYSASDKKVEYNYDGKKFEWNNKNWRQMVFVSETNSQMIFSLQYPFQSEEISKEVRKMMEDRLTKKLRLKDKWLIRNHKENIEVKNSCYSYNDIGRESCKYVINKYDINKTCTINAGKLSVKCLNADYEMAGDGSIWD